MGESILPLSNGVATSDFEAIANPTFLSLLDSFDSVVLVLDGRGLILHASANSCAMTGLDSASLTGQRLGQTGLPREFLFTLRSREREVLSQGGESAFEAAMPSTRGVRWFHWSLKPLDTPVGRVVMCYGRDMEGERHLREVEHLLFTSLVDGYAVHEMLYDEHGKAFDYRFVMVNPAFERLTGLVAGEIVGRTVRTVLPETEQSWIDVYAQVLAERSPVYFSNYSRSFDRYYDVQAFPLEGSRFAVVFRDVTKARKAEEEIRKEQEKTVRIMELSPAGTLLVDAHGTITFANQRACDFLGIDLASASGRRFDDPRLHIFTESGWPVSDSDSIVRLIQRSGQAVYGQCFRVGEHSHRYLTVNGAPVLGKSGEVETIVLTMEDISERKANEARLERTLREKHVLIHEMNHRVKNNLAVILGMVRMHRGTKGSSADAVIKSMEDRIYAIGVLHGMLFDADGPRQVAPIEYLRQILTHLEASYAGGSIHVESHLSGEMPPGIWPPEVLNALGLIMNELVSNAFKYAFGCRDLDQPGTIKVLLQTSAERVELVVEDDGCGFDPVVLNDPGAVERGGRGMNLVMHLCNSLGGQVKLENTPAGGARACLVLPVEGAFR